MGQLRNEGHELCLDTFRPSSEPMRISARSRLPVEMCTHRYLRLIKGACVPFPEQGCPHFNVSK